LTGFEPDIGNNTLLSGRIAPYCVFTPDLVLPLLLSTACGYAMLQSRSCNAAKPVERTLNMGRKQKTVDSMGGQHGLSAKSIRQPLEG